MQNLSAEDFYKPTPYNQITKNQIWLSQIQDSHDNFCNCHCPFSHLLASIFPPGHKDRDLSINQILQRDYTEACRSGGTGEENHGGEKPEEGGDTNPIKPKEEEDLPEEEIEGLLAEAAAAAAAESR